MIKVKEFLLDLVFPRFCVGCGKEGKWLCRPCQQAALLVKTQVCPACGRVSQKGKYCRLHQKRWGLSGIIVAAYYEEGPIKEAIHNFKYNHILELGDFLGSLMAEALKENQDLGQKILITAAPLHFLRRAQRGYNQSEILAKIVSAKLNLRANFHILKKIRRTKPQVKFSGKKRRENLKNSFKIYNNVNLRGRTIVIVDDVTTTGATLNECAKVLRKAGAKKVWGLVVAKG